VEERPFRAALNSFKDAGFSPGAEPAAFSITRDRRFSGQIRVKHPAVLQLFRSADFRSLVFPYSSAFSISDFHFDINRK
jgi:hypothetical protein